MTAVITDAGGHRKAGGCATTALFLHQLLHAHPMVQFPLETIVEFLIAHLNGDMRLLNAAAWEKKLVHLQQGGRWGRVYGTMSAAMASLLDTEFEIPPSINSWMDPTGQVWTISFDEPMLVPAVREVVQHFLLLKAWSRAQDHTFGDSMGLRPDFRAGLARMKQARKKHELQELY